MKLSSFNVIYSISLSPLERQRETRSTCRAYGFVTSCQHEHALAVKSPQIRAEINLLKYAVKPIATELHFSIERHRYDTVVSR